MSTKLDPLVNRSAANTLYKNQKRISSKYDQNITIGAAGAGSLLEVCYPIGFNEATSKHTPWVAPDPTVLAIFLGTTPATGGTFSVVVNDSAELDIAFDATAAEVVAAIKGIGYEVSCDLASDTYTITFDGQAEIETLPTVVGDITDLTGDTASSATTTAGTATNGADRIRGFINPNDTQTGTTTGSVSLTRATTLATATQATPHGLATGMSVTVSGASNAAFNVTATITVTSDYAFTYAVADSGSTSDTGTYTTTNDEIATMMIKGEVHYDDIWPLVATADVTALQTALRADLIPDGLIIQGLTAVH